MYDIRNQSLYCLKQRVVPPATLCNEDKESSTHSRGRAHDRHESLSLAVHKWRIFCFPGKRLEEGGGGSQQYSEILSYVIIVLLVYPSSFLVLSMPSLAMGGWHVPTYMWEGYIYPKIIAIDYAKVLWKITFKIGLYIEMYLFLYIIISFDNFLFVFIRRMSAGH